MNMANMRLHPRFFRHQAMLKVEGFSLVEFLVSVVILMVLSAGIFTMLTDAQGTTGYQTEVLGVMENTRVAMSILGRYIVQAGNNPRAIALTPVTITDAAQVQLCSDLTGSAGGSQGDPDGDILDADENITIQYNSNARSIELVNGNGAVRNLAQSISGLSMQYLNASGTTATTGADVRSIRVTINGASTVANARTKKTFGQTLTGVFTLTNRG